MKYYFIRFFRDPQPSETAAELKKQTDLLQQMNGTLTTTQKDAKKAAEDVVALQVKYEAEVARLNTDITAKGATIGQLQEAVTELKAKQGHLKAESEKTIKNVREVIAKNFEDTFDKVKTGKAFQFGIEQKAVGTMTSSANLTGSVVLSYNLIPAVRGRQAVHMRDLVSTIPSQTGVWTFYRQNDPVGEGSFGFQTAGAAKQQLDYDTTQVTVNAEYLAGYSRIARQMMQDLPFLQTFVNNELIEDYLRRESFEFFQTLVTGATGSTATTATPTVEKIIDYIANLYTNNYQPNAIVVRPGVWASILKTKPNDYSIPGGVQISPSGDVMIVGIPLVVCTSNGLADSKILIGDFSKAAIIQTDGLNVGMFEQDQDNVIKNLITLRVESRVGFANLRPDAFIYANS